MTREEAIKFANCLKNNYTIDFNDMADFCEMAIKALQQQPSEDCISRDATLTAFSDYVGGGMSMNDFDAMWDIVVKMPPVEPKPKTSEDCISRKAVLDALHSKFADGFDGDKWWNSTHVLDAVNRVPSATPQPKTGHWTHDGGYWENRWICSECGYKFYDEQSKYCPNCGSYNGGTK